MRSHVPTCTAFDGHSRIAMGSHAQVAIAVKETLARSREAAVLIFDDQSGNQIDFDLRGSNDDVAARLSKPATKADENGSTRGPGRPKLGVVAREVTLLPRHWDWLSTQSGGASVALRKLVEEARRVGSGTNSDRKAQDRTYRFMSAMAGNLPGFEEASRALFAGDYQRLRELMTEWPNDIRDHVGKMTEIDQPQTSWNPSGPKG